MFIGTTTIELNTATMLEALQEYLEKRVNFDDARTFRVTQIRAGATHEATFSVTLEENKPAKAA